MTNWLRTVPTLVAVLAALGLLTGAPANAKVEGDTIIFGAALSFTGKYKTNGQHTENGYELAVKRINELGGVRVGDKNYQIKIQYYDDESTPARGAQLVERLIKQDGIKFMLGPYSSRITKVVSYLTEVNNVPMVEAEGASRSLFTQGFQYMFAVLSTSEKYLAGSIELAAEIAEKQGKKPSDLKLALVFANDPFSLDVRAGVVDEASKYGMKIVIDDKMPRDRSDLSATLTKVKALKPDVLVISGHSKGAATAARQIKEMNINVPMIALTHCAAARVIRKFGAATEGFLCPTQWAETLSYSGKYFGSAADYDKLFKATYSGYRNVPYQAAQASAAVLVFADALERAGSFDVEKVRAALAATEMQTFYGNIKFDASGKNMKPMVLRQIQNGRFVAVAPTKWAPSKVVHPRRVPVM